MKLVSLALFAVLVPTLAAGQNRGVFIQAGPFADVLFSSRVDGDLPVSDFFTTTSPALLNNALIYTWSDLGQQGPLVIPRSSLYAPLPATKHMAAGTSVALGIFVSPSVSLRVEGAFQGTRVSTAESTNELSLIHSGNRVASQFTDYVVAAGWHQGGSRRATIAYLAGMVVQRQNDRITPTVRYSGRSAPPGQPTLSSAVVEGETIGSTLFNAGVMAGIDIPIRISTRFAIIPQFRSVYVSHHLELRPGVAMRWHP